MAISSTTIQGDPNGSATPISVAALPLPTGASTEATLSSLNGKVTAVNTGAVTISSALPAGTNVIGHVITDSGSTTSISNATIAVTQSTSPWVVSLASTTITGTVAENLTQLNSVALGSPSAYGTSPGAVNVLGVNAFITNTPGVTVASLSLAQGSTTSGQTGPLVMGAVTTAAPTYTTAQTSPLSLTIAGALRIDNSSWIGSTAPTVGSKTSANSIPVVIASDQGDVTTSLNALVSAKTNVMKTGSLATTAATADQVVLTYTVTSGKTFYLEYSSFMAYITTLPGNTNPVLLGTISLESPAGTKLITGTRIHADYLSTVYPFSDPLPIASGTVIRVVCTPATATSYTWRANFGGYEA